MSPGTARIELADADMTAIRALIEPWTTACLERNWDRLLGMCTSDIVFLPPNDMAVQGPALRPWLEQFPTIKQMDWGIDHLEGLGGLATFMGWVQMTMEQAGREIQFNGKYTDVARKQTDGTWRLSLVMWNSNEPS